MLQTYILTTVITSLILVSLASVSGLARATAADSTRDRTKRGA